MRRAELRGVESCGEVGVDVPCGERRSDDVPGRVFAVHVRDLRSDVALFAKVGVFRVKRGDPG